MTMATLDDGGESWRVRRRRRCTFAFAMGMQQRQWAHVCLHEGVLFFGCFVLGPVVKFRRRDYLFGPRFSTEGDRLRRPSVWEYCENATADWPNFRVGRISFARIWLVFCFRCRQRRCCRMTKRKRKWIMSLFWERFVIFDWECDRYEVILENLGRHIYDTMTKLVKLWLITVNFGHSENHKNYSQCFEF